MKRPLTLEGKLFGLRIPQHANLGCLAMLVGSIFAFWLSMALAYAMFRANLDERNPYYSVTALAVISFATGLLVAMVCREKRGLYAALTTLFFPLSISIRLFFYLLAEALDREFLHSFIIAIFLCPAAAYMGAKAWEKLRASMRKPEKV